MITNMASENDKLFEQYIDVAARIAVFTTFVGISVSVAGEITDTLSIKPKHSPLTAFINITGCASLGLLSGMFWPISVPLLGVTALINKMLEQ
jgi:hypothetical protein